MADVTSLLNMTVVDQSSIDQMAGQIDFLLNIFKALGGIFLLGVLAWILNARQAKKQRKLLEEMNRKLDILIKKK